MKYHGEHKNSIVNFDVSGDNINRVIITSGRYHMKTFDI